MILQRLITIQKMMHGFFKLKITDKSEMDSLMNKEEYEKFSKESGS
jgi:glycine cleavage system H lipoate-binding protein